MNFDIVTTELLRGSTLIEASAGTGKTEAIAGIFLRLVLERKVTVDKILVVTFTEAATAELRDRIRRLLAEARAVLLGSKAKTPYLAGLLQLHGRDAKALELLDAALRDFDRAAIFTIHGFCQRALRENAFESRMLFDTELVTDEQQLLREVLQDFWRKNFYEQDAILVNFALRNKSSPDDFLALVRKRLNYHHVRVATRPGIDRESAAEKLLETFAKAKRLWCVHKKDVAALIKAAGWAKGPHNKADVVDANLSALNDCFETSNVSPAALDCIDFFCSEKLKENTAKRGPGTPQHQFFSICDELCEREADYICALELDCLHFVENELNRRKQRRNVQFFHDLLANLHRALTSRGSWLAETLRKRYEAALIDEFQDTDPLQYDIFRRIFVGEENFLFLIGDPKQAIYGFRGADIFTYLKAYRETPRRFSLPKNYRSESRLVHAVNTLFQTADAPFVFPEIEFNPVAAAGVADQQPLTTSDGKDAPLQFWQWKESLGTATKGNAEKWLPQIIAAEISRLLRSGAKIGDESLKPKHFAVLVLENQQAQQMQSALSALQIPSVVQASESLFRTAEAEECERLLRAITQPANERLIRAALATDILGLTGAELQTLSNEEGAWQQWLEKFRGWLELWLSRGFIQMFRTFLLNENVRERLLKLPDGERRLTNVLHLSEAIQSASVENKLGVQGVLDWLADQMRADGDPAEENQLRLERDEEAVQLVTVHKSKGLQYPIVFCPFSWKPARSKRQKDQYAWYHEEGEMALDLGSPELDSHRGIELQEMLAERVRLLYVAATRAKNRCYIVWSNFNEAETSAPAYLLHQPENANGDRVATTIERFAGLDDKEFRSDLSRLVAASKDEHGRETILVEELPDPDETPYQSQEAVEEPGVENFSAYIEYNWKLVSFSGLVQEHWAELGDFDAFADPAKNTTEASGIFAFEHTTKAGRCVHKIFELIEFDSTAPDHIEEVVRTNLQTHGFSEEHHATLCETVRHTLARPLDSFSLKEISRANRLSELEFSFPLREIAPATLQRVFERHGIPIAEFPTQVGKLTFNPLKGLLRGVIDLVVRHDGKFYIVDWKSNWLGNRLEDYSPERIRADMLKHNYLLQYHLYVIALHNYLKLRLPDYDYARDFGGVFYIFIRATDPAHPDFGLFRDCPSAALIDELDSALIERSGA